MSTINAQMVKELRRLTGVGMMECKKALQESDGDMDLAKARLTKPDDDPLEPEPEPVE